MAHELEFRKDGVANMFYSPLGGTPWHEFGVQLKEDEHYDFDGVMTKHFGYPLEKLPHYIPANEEKTAFVESEDSFYIYRRDTDKILGPVGSTYEIVTNPEAFEVLKPLVDTKVATLETGGVLREGADAWMMVRWDLEKFGEKAKEVFRRDGGMLPYGTVMANHSGRRGLMLGETSIRIVCKNTLMAAEASKNSRWKTIAHKGNAKSKLVEAAQEVFHSVVERFETIASQYDLLMNTHLDEEFFKTLVQDVIAPDPRKDPKFNPEAKMAELVVERAMKKRLEVRRLWQEGKGHTGEKNAWYALQAACELTDHNKQLFPNKAGSWRTASLLTGTLANIKAKVTDNLVNYATTV